MRPLHLELCGIGPFAGTQRIDFASLDDRALFLIHGPTGQGKSFIFDVLCYALYADTPAGREDNLKSDYLSDGVEPYIDFKFSLGRDSYRVRRALPYNRPRKRGEGVTTTTEVQSLSILNPDGSEGEILADKKSEVNNLLKDLIGLDSRQFRQVVMIPQGDFRKLLLADSGERESLLERLFDTSFYLDVQDRIKEMEDESNLEEKSSADQIERLKGSLVDLWQAEDLSPSFYEEGALLIGDAENELKEKKALLSAADRAASRARDKAAAELAKAGELNKHHLRLEELKGLKRELELSEPIMLKLAEKLKRDSRALAIKDSFQELSSARNNAESAEDELKEANHRLEALLEQKKSLELRLQQAPGEKAHLEILSRRIPLYSGFRNDFHRRLSIQKKIDETQALLAALDVSRVKWQENKDTLSRREEEIACSLLELEALGSRETRAQLIHSLEELSGLHLTLTENEVKLAEARRIKEDSAGSLMRLKSRREVNLAGELAASLEDEKPCPVCGSIHHPSPAHPGDGSDPGEIEAAEGVLTEAESRFTALQTLITSDKKKIEELTVKIPGEDTGVNDVPERIRTLKEGLGTESVLLVERDAIRSVQLPELAAESERLTGRKEQKTQELKNLQGDLEEMGKRWNAALSNRPADDTEAPPSLEELPVLLGNWEDEKLQLTELLRLLDLEERGISEKIIAAETDTAVRKGQQKKNLENLARREKTFTEVLESSGFSDEEALETALKQAETTETDGSKLEEWQNRKNENVTMFEETIRNIAGRLRPDLSLFEREKSKTSELADGAARALAAAEEKLKKAQSLGKELKMLEEASREKALRNGVIRRLSGQLRGTMPPKISLNRFFLSRRLEEVLVQATLRLSLLSRGRFTLKRRDEGKTASARAGLDLLISDAWTGTERPVNTLSGGQLFMASLSLALGLADVVQARSGGVRLEALFIDEGFGTLDDEALQGVLQVLNNLRENRMVGVISHVPELKRQIADRIEVYRDEPGSALRMVSGG
ncbi:MAG: hypothetical protein DRP70_07970 [Spirochaetes bacterium]|nr:MAG: hypothetical protein DRP70_07970 [Spirochaetota bacterium]